MIPRAMNLCHFRFLCPHPRFTRMTPSGSSGFFFRPRCSVLSRADEILWPPHKRSRFFFIVFAGVFWPESDIWQAFLLPRYVSFFLFPDQSSSRPLRIRRSLRSPMTLFLPGGGPFSPPLRARPAVPFYCFFFSPWLLL